MQHRHLRLHLVGHVGPVDAPLAAQHQHQFVAVEGRPVAGRLAMTLVERVSVFTESVPDEARVGISAVGDEQCTHWEDGTKAQVAKKTFFSSV